MRKRAAAPILFVLTAIGCGADAIFDPADIAGRYPLVQVDGHALGWYHQLGAVDCRAAFLVGELDILPNRSFDLHLDYDYRCLGANPFDGSANLRVHGNRMREAGDVVQLLGFGPDLINPSYIDNWTLEVRVSGPEVTVRFAGFARTYWGDPVLTMGPRR